MIRQIIELPLLIMVLIIVLIVSMVYIIGYHCIYKFRCICCGCNTKATHIIKTEVKEEKEII